MHNEGWLEVAKEAEIELWARQPRETDREWQIWLHYRDQYPSKKPTYASAAETVGTTVSNVRSVGSRWDFSVRMQAWAKHCDLLTQAKRQEEILGMNAKHVSMAKSLNEKLAQVIENLDVENVTPAQLSSLMKMATDLERKARLDTVVTDGRIADVRDEMHGKDTGVVEKAAKREELQQVVDILAKAGVLGALVGAGPGAKLKTTTTTTTELTDQAIEVED
jgi:hypothetical protein